MRLTKSYPWITVRVSKIANAKNHPQEPEQARIRWASWQGAVIRVRRDPTYNPSGYAKVGCAASKFFQLHPEDAKRIRGDEFRWVCEHEIELI